MGFTEGIYNDCGDGHVGLYDSMQVFHVIWLKDVKWVVLNAISVGQLEIRVAKVDRASMAEFVKAMSPDRSWGVKL